MSIASTLSTYVAWSRHLLQFLKVKKDLMIFFLKTLSLTQQTEYSRMLFSGQMQFPKQCVTTERKGKEIHKKQTSEFLTYNSLRPASIGQLTTQVDPEVSIWCN